MGKCIIRIYDENTGELTQKQCSKCGKVKDVSEFYKDSRYSDGLKSNCKSCAKGNTKKSRERKTPEGKEKWKDKLKAMNEEEANKFFQKNMIRIKKGGSVIIKRCTDCMEYKVVSDFSKSKSKNQKDGIRKICKECAVEKNRKRYEANPDYWKNKDRKYRQTPEGKEVSRRKNQKRRLKVKESGGTWTLEEWEVCLKFFDYKCAYTGQPMNVVTMDHIVALNKGGTNNISNIIPADVSPNSSKCDKDLWEWYSQQPYFSWERYIKICMWIIKSGGASKDINIKE